MAAGKLFRFRGLEPAGSIQEASEQGWAVRTLERNINSFYYERLLASKDKEAAIKHSSTLEKQRTEDFIKDIGQMDMYRRLFDDLKKPKYSIINDSKQLFATHPEGLFTEEP